MTMRKYIVTIHGDGHITADEYEEPKGFVYCASDAPSIGDDYNHALADVITVLKAEKSRCEAYSMNGKFDHGWSAIWAGRAVECELLKTSIKKLFRKF